MIRCFLSLVSVALLSEAASAQCVNGVCPVPQYQPVAYSAPVTMPAYQPVPAYQSMPVVQSYAPTERVVSFYPGFLRPLGVSRVDVVFGQPMTSRTLATLFRGRFRR